MMYRAAGTRDASRAQAKAGDGHEVVVMADREERS